MTPEIIVDPNPFQKAQRQIDWGNFVSVVALAILVLALVISVVQGYREQAKTDNAAHAVYVAERQKVEAEKAAAALAAQTVVSDESLGKILSARIISLAGKYPSVLTEVVCEKRMVPLPNGPSVPIGAEGRWQTMANGSTRFYWPTNTVSWLDDLTP